MASKKSASGKEVTNTDIYKVLLSIDGRITNIEERLSDMATKDDLEELATKSDLENVEKKLLDEIKIIGKAVDKDALTLVNLEKRVVRIEKVLALKD